MVERGDLRRSTGKLIILSIFFKILNFDKKHLLFIFELELLIIKDDYEVKDLRSTTRRNKPPTQVGSNLTIVEKPLPKVSFSLL